MKRQVIKNIFSLYSVQGLNYIVPLVLTPYLVSMLGLTEFGVYTITLASLQYVIILSDYGFNLSATKKIAIEIENKNKVSSIFWAVIICKLFIASISFAILFSISSFFNIRTDLLLAGVGIVAGASFYPVWLFQGYEKMYWIAIFNAISKVLTLFLVFIFIKNGNDLYKVILIQSLLGFSIAMAACYKAIVGKYIYIVKPSMLEIKNQLVIGWDIFVSTLFVSFYTTSIPIFLGVTVGAESAGIYNAADKIRQALQGLIGPIAQAIYPRVNKMVMSSKEDGIKFAFNIYKYIISIIMVLSIFIFIFSNDICLILYKGHSENISSVLDVIIFIPPLVAIANMIGLQIMLPLEMVKEFRNTYIFVGVLGCPILYLSSNYFGLFGVAFSALFVEFCIVLVFFNYIRRVNFI